MDSADKIFSVRWSHLNMHCLIRYDDEQLYYTQCCRRVTAIKRVLGRMPSDAISRLEQLNKEKPLYWILPSKRFYGMLQEAPQGRMIYLTQLLELLNDSAIAGVVAHELAHLAQGHLDVPVENRGHDTTEKDADETAIGWGFAEELDAFREESSRLERRIWGELEKSLITERAEQGNRPAGERRYLDE